MVLNVKATTFFLNQQCARHHVVTDYNFLLKVEFVKELIQGSTTKAALRIIFQNLRNNYMRTQRTSSRYTNQHKNYQGNKSPYRDNAWPICIDHTMLLNIQ